MRNARPDDIGVKIGGRNINNPIWFAILVESEEKEDLKILEGEGRNCNSWSKTKCEENQSPDDWIHQFTANTEGEELEVLNDFVFLGSKTSAGSDRGQQIKMWLFLERNDTIYPNSVLKSGHVSLPTKIRVVKSVGFQL